MNSRSSRIAFLTLVICTVSEACQVPVFRYALERWRPDPYELVIVHENPLSEAQAATLVHLEESLVGKNGPIVNLRYETIDLTKEKDRLDEWKKIHAAEQASVTAHLFYPHEAYRKESRPIWSGPFTKENVDAVLDSPMRRELVNRILAGDSAVWLFLESGNKEQDDKLIKTLQGHAETAGKEIEIPKGVIQKSALDDPDLQLGPSDAENILESSVPLKIDFTIRRLSRKDPQEAVLRAMLLHLEDDLLDEEMADKPMVFPAFGKGRVLPPLIGKGINEENILGDCSYLCGPCSCQVKNQNPGMDLLVKADWWTALEGSSVIEEKELPPLTGVEDLLAAAEPNDDTNVSHEKSLPASNSNDGNETREKGEESEETSSFPGTFWMATLIILAILGAGTVILNKNSEK
tara:strand:- start:1242 stop:2459 length:1218 start_codon:yes stop_codon:yes gene_type:complete